MAALGSLRPTEQQIKPSQRWHPNRAALARQPLSSTRHDPSAFEHIDTAHTRTNQLTTNPSQQAVKKKQDWHDDSEQEGDLEEDHLIAIELHRLQESGGTAAPLWAKIPEFRGYTAATKAYQLRKQSKNN